MKAIELLLALMLIILGISIGIMIDHRVLHQTEYHIQLLDYDDVQILDENHKLLKTTTADSIGYYLEHENI
jgi:hypothetical protein